MAEILIVLVLIGGGWLIWEIIKGRAPQPYDAGSEALANATYRDNTLIVKKRHSSLFDAIEVEACRTLNVSYTPDRYVYTGATVGGVHTGGVTKLDGGYSVRPGDKTGDYMLCFKYGKYNEFNNYRWSSEYLSCIVLTKSDFNLAKKDATLRRFIPNEERKTSLTSVLSNNLTKEEADRDLTVVSLTKAEAEYIRNWLAQKL